MQPVVHPGLAVCKCRGGCQATIGHSPVDGAGFRARCFSLCVPLFSDVQVDLATKPGALLEQQLFCTCACMEDQTMKSQCP